jgi:nucleotide-binding universal stress UspA family protein
MGAARDLVVGVDGSLAGDVALVWAMAEAARTGTAVHVVAAWHWRPVHGTVVAATTAESLREWTERMVGGAVAGARAAHPEVPVTATVVEGDAAHVLTHSALDGDLIVLGTHRHGRIHQAVLGSTIEQCVRRAPCPVVVVPDAVRVPAAAPTRGPAAHPARLGAAVVGVAPARPNARLVLPLDVLTLNAPASNGDSR